MKQSNSEIEKYRVKTGLMASDISYGNNGAFIIRYKEKFMSVIASDQMGWEHVSVSTVDRYPTWDEMNFIKNLFWDENETVIQFHPRKSEYINCHPFCLHLWKKVGIDFELPPKELIGW